MHNLLIPLVAFALIGASDETDLETPPTAESDLQVEELRDDFERFADRQRANRAFGLPYDGVFAHLLNRSKKGLPTNCNDRLERAESGKSEDVIVTPGPLLRRGPSNTETPPLAIYAVDRRENGCGVMVVMGDPEDVRPLPSLSADDHRLMPADGDQD
ncbi:MAG: hypothetical protein AAF291_04060 [Pseudomonadota bacterium]